MIGYDKIYRIDRDSFPNQRDVQRLEKALANLQASQQGQKIFGELMQDYVATRGHPITIRYAERTLSYDWKSIKLDVAFLDSLFYPAQNEAAETVAAPISLEGFLLHESDHILRFHGRKEALNLACSEEHAMQRTNEYRREKGLPMRVQYEDALLYAKHVPKLLIEEVGEGSRLHRFVSKTVRNNAGCSSLPHDEITRQTKEIVKQVQGMLFAPEAKSVAEAEPPRKTPVAATQIVQNAGIGLQ